VIYQSRTKNPTWPTQR